jgi:hypothetical protein
VADDVEAVAGAVAGVASAIASASGSDGTTPSMLPDDEPSAPEFDEASAFTALEAIDLSPCRQRGAPSGTGRAHVLFRSDGAVTRLEVLSPRGMPESAVSCIEGRLFDAAAPPFHGAPTEVWTDFRIP